MTRLGKVSAGVAGSIAGSIAVAAAIVTGFVPTANEAGAQAPADAAGHAAGADPAQIKEGRHLATQVAMCVQCHTPRDANGDLIERRLFEGAPMPVESPYANQKWAFLAPPIAGLPGGWTEADLVTLLTTGERPRGTAPSPPMPPFRMTKEEAAAIAAYLNSLR